ncbi:uncharacterized protein [Penaeus vannamei]|uniref:uncharacterized protein n=1 Tax=Penaeus vannamei TaxID=6689 RepID=UPI00387F40D7
MVETEAVLSCCGPAVFSTPEEAADSHLPHSSLVDLRLREGEYARGFDEAISGRFTRLDSLMDPVLLWDTFTHETLDAAQDTIERRCEFGRGLLAAYIDLKKSFNTVHRESLWEMLRLRGIPTRIIGLIASLYTGTQSAVKCGGGLSSFFHVTDLDFADDVAILFECLETLVVPLDAFSNEVKPLGLEVSWTKTKEFKDNPCA